MRKLIAHCISGHRKSFSGPFAGRRHDKWWAKHSLCDTHECDTCHNHFDKSYPPADSFQTYNGEWFCSDECGRKAGW